MREIKFRAWNRYDNEMQPWESLIKTTYNQEYYRSRGESDVTLSALTDQTIILEQFTGLKDKNGAGLIELYEGDIIDESGAIRATIHQEHDRRSTDLIIARMGTSAWRDTESEAIRRGFGYAE